MKFFALISLFFLLACVPRGVVPIKSEYVMFAPSEPSDEILYAPKGFPTNAWKEMVFKYGPCGVAENVPICVKYFFRPDKKVAGADYMEVYRTIGSGQIYLYMACFRDLKDKSICIKRKDPNEPYFEKTEVVK